MRKLPPPNNRRHCKNKNNRPLSSRIQLLLIGVNSRHRQRRILAPLTIHRRRRKIPIERRSNVDKIWQRWLLLLVNKTSSHIQTERFNIDEETRRFTVRHPIRWQAFKRGELASLVIPNLWRIWQSVDYSIDVFESVGEEYHQSSLMCTRSLLLLFTHRARKQSHRQGYRDALHERLSTPSTLFILAAAQSTFLTNSVCRTNSGRTRASEICWCSSSPIH